MFGVLLPEADQSGELESSTPQSRLSDQLAVSLTLVLEQSPPATVVPATTGDLYRRQLTPLPEVLPIRRSHDLISRNHRSRAVVIILTNDSDVLRLICTNNLRRKSTVQTCWSTHDDSDLAPEHSVLQ